MRILFDRMLLRLAWLAIALARFCYRRFAYELEVRLRRNEN